MNGACGGSHPFAAAMAEKDDEYEDAYCILEVPKLVPFGVDLSELAITDFTQNDRIEATVGDLRLTGKKRKVLGTFAVVQNDDIREESLILTTDVVVLDKFSIAKEKLAQLEAEPNVQETTQLDTVNESSKRKSIALHPPRKRQ